jgi:hypothetical protein
MRAAYGSNYGISLTLAPDYWYLRWFDAKAMEPYVDFFGFMAYDLRTSPPCCLFHFQQLLSMSGSIFGS